MDWLAGELVTLALCWRLERRDGVTLGFTTHDRTLTVAGVPYLSAPGMLPSALGSGDGFEAGTLDVSGALTHDAITAADLADGRWDGAALTLFAVDWRDPAASLALARGELGDVSIAGGGFTAELRGPAAVLDRPAAEETSPACRATLGDRRCRIDMAGRTTLRRVLAIDDAAVTVDGPAAIDDAWAEGRLRWVGGANSGLEAGVIASAGTVLTLRDPPPRHVETGTLVELREGCDRRFETCRTRFSNTANFRGEPHLPGNDLLARYAIG